ncbi:NADH dehydrogenase subunit 2 (mitochondrion) [Culicoides brevitarsis]|uniref:NADH dehydrogenase subunit 2 n=1 Tax=Culicoides brevitarsis TaxID=469753 RepID=UPI002E7A7AF3|nr:NADH dehydrogenase subunit 2 [Culicoides brevitarsis]WPN85970.1 NADH dehydrogenase subunit 2 [Culicoides brevitarsis]
MINYIYKMFFIFMLFIGTIMTISSSSWLGMWMGLEMNLMSFIPLISEKNNLNSTEMSIKYFLVQALASMVFLFVSIMYMLKFSNFNYIFLSYESILLIFSMMMKLGAAPFHFWFPNIIEGLSWMNSLLLLTWQKLAPLTIVSYFSFLNQLIIFILLSCFVGAVGGLNQTSLQKLLSFSSINHISWLLMAMTYSNYLWLLYFFIYFILNLCLIMIFKNFNLFNFNQLYMFKNNGINSNLLKILFMMNFFSLGGLPPFLGFLPKWMVIEFLLMDKMFFLILFLVMMSLLTLFFYMRLTLTSFVMFYPSMKWNFLNFKKNKMMKLIIFFNIVSLYFFLIFLLNNYMF